MMPRKRRASRLWLWNSDFAEILPIRIQFAIGLDRLARGLKLLFFEPSRIMHYIRHSPELSTVCENSEDQQNGFLLDCICVRNVKEALRPMSWAKWMLWHSPWPKWKPHRSKLQPGMKENNGAQEGIRTPVKWICSPSRNRAFATCAGNRREACAIQVSRMREPITFKTNRRVDCLPRRGNGGIMPDIPDP